MTRNEIMQITADLTKALIERGAVQEAVMRLNVSARTNTIAAEIAGEYFTTIYNKIKDLPRE